MNHKDAKHFTWDQRLTLERMLQKRIYQGRHCQRSGQV